MSNQVERLRYYDGEYLRSHDFTDEQAYHIEMRRRLNHRLHLHGIVYGLEIQQDQESVSPDAIFYSIAQGMALDQTGREIFITEPYPLSSENILNRPGLMTNEPYEVWLCYLETQTGLPAAGYRDCNEKAQQTRWQEDFQVILKPVNPTKNSYIPPDCSGVRLGIVYLDSTNGWQISSNPAPANTGRVYVGIRAQRVIAANEVKDPFDMTIADIKSPVPFPPPGYVDVKPGIVERGNLFVEKNLVVGKDFEIDTSKLDPSNKIPEAGNLIVTSDLFLKGDLYGFMDGKWRVLAQLIRNLSVKFVIGPAITITPTPIGNGAAKPSDSNPATSGQFPNFPSATTPQVLLAINAIEWQDPQTLAKWAGKGAIKVTVTQPAININVSPGFNTLTVTWTASPIIDDGTNFIYPITNLVVGFVVIYQP